MFYDRYVSLCKNAGFSPSAAAIKAGINKGTISVWKKKREQNVDVDPDKSTIEKLCAFFEITEAELRGVVPPSPKKESPAQTSEASATKQALIEFASALTDEQAALALRILKAALEDA